LQPNFTASRMTTRSAYGSCREALRIANACSVTLRTVYFWSEPENRHGKPDEKNRCMSTHR
jgi:hypothetical protein